MKFIHLLLLLGLSFSANFSLAKTLVVSDIDDTLKIAHILNTSDSIQNAFSTSNVFLGMSDAYQKLAQNKEIEFVYVSNAIQKMMQGKHEEFLRNHQFPAGHVLLRKSLFESDHKTKTIRKLIQDKKPDHVVFIGDNGERDPEVADQMRTEFPQVIHSIFIHQVYSVMSEKDQGSSLFSHQIGFATAIDLSISLAQIKMITVMDLQDLIQKLTPPILSEPLHEKEGSLAFPSWMDCRDHVAAYSPEINSLLTQETQIVLLRYEMKRSSRCQVAPFED